MAKIIKTIEWSATKDRILSLASSDFGKTRLRPESFVGFIAGYPHCVYKSLLGFFNRVVTYKEFKDVTSSAVIAEDSCLLFADANDATTINILFRYLDILSTGGRVPALWCYIDDEKDAVAHFVNRNGYFVELFCKSEEEFSVLHLVENEGKTSFVPVVFSKDLSKACASADLRGEVCLHDYLPREKFDFLSKGGSKGKRTVKSEFDEGRRGSIDAGDSL